MYVCLVVSNCLLSLLMILLFVVIFCCGDVDDPTYVKKSAVTTLVLSLVDVVQPRLDDRMALVYKVLWELTCGRVLEFTLVSPWAVPE